MAGRPLGQDRYSVRRAFKQPPHNPTRWGPASLALGVFLWGTRSKLRYFCSPQHKDSPLYPIIDQMQHAAGLSHEDSQQAKLNKLDGMLAQTRTPTENAPLFAEMLSLANDGRYPALALDRHHAGMS
jgi:hypothetical protein